MRAAERAEREQASVQRRTTLVSIAAAAVLVAIKLGVGLAAGSLALISAGVESSGDVLAAVLTFFVVRLSRQPADPEHPYGHARAENLGALGEAAILLAGGVLVAVEAISRLLAPGAAPDTRLLVFAVIALALLVDLSRTVVLLRAARRYGSPALRSNAFHFAGDLAGSLVVLVGLLLVRAGFARADAIAALAIAAIILVAALRLIAENANVLMDRTPIDAYAAAERAVAELRPEIELLRLRLRESAGRYFADAIVAVAPGQAVIEGHQAATLVERAIQRALPGSDVVVHVEPRRDGLDVRDRVLAAALAEPLVREVHDITVYEHGATASVTLHLKFPAEIELEQALAASERIERTIRERPDVSEVQTHLEPLERPLRVRRAGSSDEPARVGEIERAVGELVEDGSPLAKLLYTDAGCVVLLTLSVERKTSLVQAHELAGEVEETLRRRFADVVDVVVHTRARVDGSIQP